MVYIFFSLSVLSLSLTHIYKRKKLFSGSNSKNGQKGRFEVILNTKIPLLSVILCMCVNYQHIYKINYGKNSKFGDLHLYYE